MAGVHVRGADGAGRITLGAAGESGTMPVQDTSLAVGVPAVVPSVSYRSALSPVPPWAAPPLIESYPTAVLL